LTGDAAQGEVAGVGEPAPANGVMGGVLKSSEVMDPQVTMGFNLFQHELMVIHVIHDDWMIWEYHH